jgi:hypothetical protein
LLKRLAPHRKPVASYQATGGRALEVVKLLLPSQANTPRKAGKVNSGFYFLLSNRGLHSHCTCGSIRCRPTYAITPKGASGRPWFPQDANSSDMQNARAMG